MNIFKKIIIILICCAFAVLLVGTYFIAKKYIFDFEKAYYSEVIDVRGSLVLLDSGKKVSLSGIRIPWKEDMLNYNAELLEYPRKLLIGKNVKIELMERQRSGAYHKHDLVRIYLEDGTCVNDYLLENGLAFFSHGYYRGKDHDFGLEAKAKREKKGIWANKDKLILLYVGSKQWEGIHYPECPEVKKTKPEDRIEYYTRPLAVHWYRDWYPEGCPYCDEIRKTKPEHLR